MRKPALEALQEAGALFAAGRLDEAKRACRKLLTRRADIAEAHVLLGEIYRQGGDEARARESITRAIKLGRGWTEAHVHLSLGDLFADFGRHADSEAQYRRALDLDPSLADARFNLAASFHASGRVAEAIAELRALLQHDPGATDAREQLVRLLQAERRFDEMETACRDGMRLHPRSAFYPDRLGVALWWRGRYEEGLAAYRTAAERAVTPEEFESAKFLEASALLSLGRYEAGWEAYQWRPTRRALRGKVAEDPRVIEGGKRIRVISEQGLGDELFFLRFAGFLRARGHRLSFSLPPKLAVLLDSESDGEADIVLASGDLPLASAAAFAPPLPIKVDPLRRDAMAARLRAFGAPPYIGVTWRAGTESWRKDVPPELLGRALRPLDARVVILQRQPSADDARRFSEGLGRSALDLSAVNDDLRDALALLSVLDEYVGVSNTNMHLGAGIEGFKARVLVLSPPEWRWGLQGSSSPWFPGFVVYRAAIGRDWTAALAQLTADLAAAQQK